MKYHGKHFTEAKCDSMHFRHGIKMPPNWAARLTGLRSTGRQAVGALGGQTGKAAWLARFLTQDSQGAIAWLAREK